LRERRSTLGGGARAACGRLLRARVPRTARPGHRTRAVGVRDRVLVARAYEARRRPARRGSTRGARGGRESGTIAARRAAAETSMTLKRDPSMALQLGFLALL